MNKKGLRIVSDGGLGYKDLADGRIIPGLILDTTDCKELEQLIENHEETGAGDVIVTWGLNILNPRYVRLRLVFTTPMELEIFIDIDLYRRGIVADRIVRSKCVMIQSNKYASRFSDGLQYPKLLVEIVPSTKLKNWNKNLLTQRTKKYKCDGKSRKEAKLFAKNEIDRSRELFDRRIK